MSEETNKKNAVAEIVQAIKEPGATNAQVVIPAAKEVVLPAAKQIGKGLEDLFFIFFSPLSNKRMEIEAKQKEFIEDVEQRVAQIDPEKITEPNLSITGRAINEAKFHVEDDEIRTMFAKLIAASVNSDYDNATLPAFVEILKQLSPFDVKNLIELYNIDKEGLGNNKVSASIRAYSDPTRGTGVTLINYFIPFKGLISINHQYYSASVENLLRLGIIDITQNYNLEDNTYQNKLKEHQLYLDVLLEFKDNVQEDPNFRHKHIDLINGVWDFTSFGQLFIECCLEEAQ
ncbi:MAG: DUF4393 domain-containing protein [Solibacillus sp.]